MKIGLVCPYNIAKGGGVQEIVRAHRAGLQARGHDAVILTPSPRELEKSHREADIIYVGAAADFKNPLHTTSQFSLTADTYGIEQMLAEEKFDVLHFHEPWVPVLSRQILSRSDSINVATFHAKLPETMMSRTVAKVVTPYTRSVLKYLDELTAVSEAAAEYVRSLTDAPVAIIPNGIDLSMYKTAKARPTNSRKKIFYVGRLEKRKGVEYLLQAYALVAERIDDIELIIAGDGSDRDKLEMLVTEFEIPHVRFLGHVSEEEKVQLLHSADLFCAPALFGESFGIVLLEAMAANLVTVAGNNPGYASVLHGLGSLSLVNPKNIEEFARRLDVMLSEDNLRKLWKKWAKEYVQQFDYPLIIDQYMAIYELALSRRAMAS